MTFKNQQEVDSALAYWQMALRLQDWKITVSILRERDMPNADSAGTVEVFHEKRQARITLCDPLDWSPSVTERWGAQDHEATLVHELLHIHLEPIVKDLDEDTKERVKCAEEQAINMLRGR